MRPTISSDRFTVYAGRHPKGGGATRALAEGIAALLRAMGYRGVRIVEQRPRRGRRR